MKIYVGDGKLWYIDSDDEIVGNVFDNKELLEKSE